jgi:hypothetical protein
MNRPNRLAPELRFFFLASAALSALALVSFLGSYLVEYISFLGQLRAIASWTPLVVIGLAVACLTMWAERVHGVRVKHARAVVLLGPVFSYAYGHVGEVGAVLYLVVIAVAYWKVLPFFDAEVTLSPETQAIIRAMAEADARATEP